MELSAKGKQERPSLPPDEDDNEQGEEEYLGTKMGPKATLPNFLHKVSIYWTACTGMAAASLGDAIVASRACGALRRHAEQQPDAATMSAKSACLGKCCSWLAREAQQLQLVWLIGATVAICRAPHLTGRPHPVDCRQQSMVQSAAPFANVLMHMC